MSTDKSSGRPEFDPEDVIASEVIEHNQVLSETSLARQVALQVLYEIDSANHPVGEVLTEQFSYHRLSDRATVFTRTVVLGVLENRARLDEVIQQFASEWPLEQVAIVDRNILRIAVFEFAIGNQTPLRVAIDEAIELAKLFGAEGTARFVNGVLGSLAGDLEAIQKSLRSAED